MPLVRLPINPVPSKAGPDDEAKRQKVLYVEDEDDNFIVAEFALRDRFDLIRARDAREACELLRNETFLIVLMDIQLSASELNGIELTQIIRGLRTKDIPEYAQGLDLPTTRIIMVTAFAARYNEEDILRAGGDELVTKPVDFVRLSRAISRLLVREAHVDSERAERAMRRQNRSQIRKEVRVKMRLDCFVQLWGQEHAAQIWDVSAAGARVLFMSNLPLEQVCEGAQCKITFSTAWGYIESEAEIMWSKKQESVEIGILFQDMQADAQQILIKELSRGKSQKA